MKVFKVLWDNEHACGEFPDTFATEAAAEAFGEAWLQDMLANDPDAEARPEAYSYEVIELSAR